MIISLAPNKPLCAYPESFNTVVKHNHIRYFTEISYKESSFNAIQFLGVDTDKLKAEACFTEIGKSKIKRIDVKGSLYLHDCSAAIESVSVMGDLYITRCAKIDHIFAKGRVSVIKSVQDGFWDCNYGEIKASHTTLYFLVDTISSVFEVKDCNASDGLIMDERIKTVEITGNCSKITRVVFQGDLYRSNERLVIIKQGGLFLGKVVGGSLAIQH